MNTNLYFLFGREALFEKINEKYYGGLLLIQQIYRKFFGKQ